MSHHAYTEDQLVEQPAIGLFATLGWQTVSALEETFGTAGTPAVRPVMERICRHRVQGLQRPVASGGRQTP